MGKGARLGRWEKEKELRRISEKKGICSQNNCKNKAKEKGLTCEQCLEKKRNYYKNKESSSNHSKEKQDEKY